MLHLDVAQPGLLVISLRGADQILGAADTGARDQTKNPNSADVFIADGMPTPGSHTAPDGIGTSAASAVTREQDAS